MEFPTITAALGAFLLVLQQALMLTVGMHRAKTKVGVGVGDDLHLERKVRRHGNLAENAAIYLIVLGIAELGGLSDNLVAAFATVFALARIMHAVGFFHLDGSHNADGHKFWIGMRAAGATLSALSGVALGIVLAYNLTMA